jgi:hypothetical protein
MAETEELRALLERRCSGMRFIEDQSIAFKSSAGFVLIVYAFVYALLNGYLLCREINVIIYAQTVPSVGVEPTLGGFIYLLRTKFNYPV